MTCPQVIKKRKPESNGPHHRYSMGEAFTAILPTFLSTLMVTMFDGLVERLQQMMARQDGVKNIPQKRALEILQAGQRRLSERIREMSSEEQFYYAYTFHSLTKSLVGYRGSLEQLEAAAETRMLVSLLVGIAHSPEEGVSEGRIGSDVVLAVIPAFSSLVHEGGVVLLQNPTVLEAFQEFDAGFDLPLNTTENSKSGRAWGNKDEGIETKKVEKVNCEDEETETEKVEKVGSEEAPVESGTSTIGSVMQRASKEIALLINGVKGRNSDLNASEADNAEEDIRRSSESVGHVLTDRPVPISEVSQPTSQLQRSHWSTGEISTMVLHEQDGRDSHLTSLFVFIAFLKLRKLKFFRRECRDGYKSVAHSEIDLTSGMVVASVAGPRWVSFGRNVRDRQTTIEDDLLWSSRDASDCCAEDEGLNHFKVAMQSASPPVESAGVIPPGFQHKCSRSNPLPPPRPPPSTSWCWKRRLESVTDPQQYICTASQEALEELDPECQETICHAIASVFGAHTAVTLIHLLHNSVSPTLFGVQDKHGNTPLHNAAIAGDAMIARKLVVLRPSAVCVRNHDCLTPLDIALDHGNDEMVECVLGEWVQSAPHNPSVIQLLESCLVKALKNGYTHFLQLVLQLRTEHGLAIDFECTDSSGHTAWHYLKQAAPAVRAVVAELLQESDLQQPLLGRLLKSLNTGTCQQSPLETSRHDTTDIVHRCTTALEIRLRVSSSSEVEEFGVLPSSENCHDDSYQVVTGVIQHPLVTGKENFVAKTKTDGDNLTTANEMEYTSSQQMSSSGCVLLQAVPLNEDTSRDQRTRRPQQYSHPCTDSLTSSAPSDSCLPQKSPVPASRKRQRHKAEQRISLNTSSSPSSSDTTEPSQRRPRESMKACFKSSSYILRM